MEKLIRQILLIAWTSILASSCHSPVQRHQFRGIYADEAPAGGGLYNPERGFRLEAALDVVRKNYVWEPEAYPDITSYLEEQAGEYASDSVSLVQTYFYLTGAVGRDLREEEFQTMEVFLDKLRELGKKAVLRFAYETEFMGRASIGPTKEDILRHADQLKPFLQANRDVIQVIQAGMIGAWGEWHSSVHGLERSDETKRDILKAICKMTPEGRYVQVRCPEYKNLLDKEPEAYKRLSFHDDFIIIKPHVWDAGQHEGTPAFDQMVRESPYLPVDGELPWGVWSMNEDPDNPEAGWIVDGLQVARRLFLQHYTSLSAIHNYKERNTKDKYSMMYWKETPVTEAFLQENGMPVSGEYFTNRDGSKAERTVFDYIRDHLGYRIELQEISAPATWTAGKAHPVEVSLINRGFSTLFNEHPVYLVLIDETGNVCCPTLTDASVRDWQPHRPGDPAYTPLTHYIRAKVELPGNLPKGTYRLGLWMPDGSESLRHNSRFAIRCANGDVEWQVTPDGRYGINVLLPRLTVQ